MPFVISAMRSKETVSFRLDTATEALAKFYKLYEQNFLHVRISNGHGKRLSVDDVVRLAALQKGGAVTPRGPKGEKRPANVIGNAVKVMKSATGEGPEDYGSKPRKNQAAAELGRKGGQARAEGLSARRQKEIAKKAAAKRWKDHRAK
jgi:hypothetical protein